MRSRTISILRLLAFAVGGDPAIFSADLQFRHHFIRRELPVTDQSVGDYGLTALVDGDHNGNIDLCSKPWGSRG